MAGSWARWVVCFQGLTHALCLAPASSIGMLLGHKVTQHGSAISRMQS